MAGGFRGGRIGILGRAGPAPPPVTPSAASGIISPTTGQSTFWLETTSLGRTTFPYAPPKWDTLNKKRAKASKKTWSSAQVEEWAIPAGANGVIGVERKLQWEILAGTDFKTLRDYYQSTEQVTWTPGARARVIGEIYYVTIKSLTHDKDHRLYDYVLGVEMILNIRGVV